MTAFFFRASSDAGGDIAEHVDEAVSAQTGALAECRSSSLAQAVPDPGCARCIEASTEFDSYGGKAAIGGLDTLPRQRQRIAKRCCAPIECDGCIKLECSAKGQCLGVCRGLGHATELAQERGDGELSAPVRSIVGAPVDIDSGAAATAIARCAVLADRSRRAFLKFCSRLISLDATALEFVCIGHRKWGWGLTFEDTGRSSGVAGGGLQQRLRRAEPNAGHRGEGLADTGLSLRGTGREDKCQCAGTSVVEAFDDEALG